LKDEFVKYGNFRKMEVRTIEFVAENVVSSVQCHLSSLLFSSLRHLFSSPSLDHRDIVMCQLERIGVTNSMH